MYNIINYLQSKGELLTGKAVDEVEIGKVEEQIGVRFANDYRKIISTYGFVCVDGHEITGITNAKRLNVYEVTMKERESMKSDISGLYVIEQANIDDIVIWQSASGVVFQTIGGFAPEKIADDIIDYLQSLK